MTDCPSGPGLKQAIPLQLDDVGICTDSRRCILRNGQQFQLQTLFRTFQDPEGKRFVPIIVRRTERGRQEFQDFSFDSIGITVGDAASDAGRVLLPDFAVRLSVRLFGIPST